MLRQSPTQFQPAQNRINLSHDLTYTARVICVRHGASVGIAIDISSACDIRLAAQDAKFSIKEGDIGLAAVSVPVGSLHREFSGNRNASQAKSGVE